MDVEAGFTEFKSLHHYVFSVFNLGANCVDFVQIVWVCDSGPIHASPEKF